MATFENLDISLYYELHGTPGRPPVMLISGLGGTGASWGSQVELFARDHFVVLPDQRGTGRTTRSEGGYTIPQLATDLASLLEHLKVGPAHIVGSSTGGAIAQLIALEHPQVVRSLVLGSTWARGDAWFQRQFALRRKLLAEADMRTIYNSYALFLFSPRFMHENPKRVDAWVERAASHGGQDREVSLKRTDMIIAHDTLARLGDIRKPTLVIGGDHDICCPPHLSEELVQRIPGAQRIVLPGGHMIHDENEQGYFAAVRDFLDRN